MGVEVRRLGQIPGRIRSLPSFHAVEASRRTCQLGSYNAGEKKAGQAECGTNPAARLAGVYLGHAKEEIRTHRKCAADRRAREAEPFQTQERLASAICRQRYLALALDVVEILRSATLAYCIVATFPDNRLRCYQSVQPCADRCLGNSEMSCHFCHGAASLIREQAEEVLVGHGLPVSRRLGCGRLGYAFHDFDLIKRGGPIRSARIVGS